MTTFSYKGVPLQGVSPTITRAFVVGMLAMLPIAFMQTLACAVALSFLTGIPTVLWAIALGALSIELTFEGGGKFRILPEPLRKNLFYVVAPISAFGFYAMPQPGIFWPSVLAFAVTYRLLFGLLAKAFAAHNKRLIAKHKIAQGLADHLKG